MYRRDNDDEQEEMLPLTTTTTDRPMRSLQSSSSRKQRSGRLGLSLIVLVLVATTLLVGTRSNQDGHQKDELRARLKINASAKQLENFFKASVELMQVMARACGHSHFRDFNIDDLSTWKKDMAELSGVEFGGVG